MNFWAFFQKSLIQIDFVSLSSSISYRETYGFNLKILINQDYNKMRYTTIKMGEFNYKGTCNGADLEILG